MINKLQTKNNTKNNKKSHVININIQELIIKQKLKMYYPNKSTYNLVIPANIFQTWHTKDLPPLMNNAVEHIKKCNPNFHYELYDDNDCREFIKNNYNDFILNAYDSLIPGAYKADLWRYCVLHKKGGIYLDIKYQPVNGFKFINLLEKEHWVLDADRTGIYNALMVCNPGNKILLYAINQIVRNVKHGYYGKNPLDPTGPLLLAKYFTKDEKKLFDMYHNYFENYDNRFIYFNNFIVLKSYNGYIEEHVKNKKVPHYGVLWNNRKIYNKIIK